ncbi:DUF1561 family protein, partial [Bartonella sp. A05]|uniref:DUF1561 family protein n=1 Tax=Bartonella sp. A05 TaxID=2967261 RepID=UPI0022A9C66B
MKQDHLKFFLFVFIFFLQVCALYASSFSLQAPISEITLRKLQFMSNDIPQRVPDPPIDKPIYVTMYTEKVYCYVPTFLEGEGYIYLDYCSSASNFPARYDVFQRIGWNINGVWLCMTAPGSVTGIEGDGQTRWDYILLRPCVINDANQRWIIKDDEGAFYTADGRFRVKHYNWYTYISQYSMDYDDHFLKEPEMKDWQKTVAAPGNISLKTTIGWRYASSSGFTMYYLTDDARSGTAPFYFYYNPENGHLASYYPGSGLLSCMVSKQSSSSDWDWIEWRFCKDIVSQGKDIAYW